MNIETMLIFISIWVDGNRVTTGFLSLMSVVFLMRFIQYRRLCSKYKKDIKKLIVALDQSVEQIKDDGFEVILDAYDGTFLAYLKKNFNNKKSGYINRNEVYFKDDYIYNLFSEEEFQKRHLEPLKFSNTSTTLVSLGVLGTFLGLILGVNDAAVGLASSDSTIARRSLESLLGGAGLAFITSLAGLSSGLLFTLITDSAKSDVLKKVGVYSELLHNKIPLININNSSAMRETLKNIESSNAESSQKMLTHLSTISNQLEKMIINQNKFENYFVKSLNHMNEKIEDSNITQKLITSFSILSKQLDSLIMGQSKINMSVRQSSGTSNQRAANNPTNEDWKN